MSISDQIQDKEFLMLNFTNSTDEFAWNFQIKYNLGYGIQKLEFKIMNSTGDLKKSDAKKGLPSGSSSSGFPSIPSSGDSSSRLLFRNLQNNPGSSSTGSEAPSSSSSGPKKPSLAPLMSPTDQNPLIFED